MFLTIDHARTILSDATKYAASCCPGCAISMTILTAMGDDWRAKFAAELDARGLRLIEGTPVSYVAKRDD